MYANETLDMNVAYLDLQGNFIVLMVAITVLLHITISCFTYYMLKNDLTSFIKIKSQSVEQHQLEMVLHQQSDGIVLLSHSMLTQDQLSQESLEGNPKHQTQSIGDSKRTSPYQQREGDAFTYMRFKFCNSSFSRLIQNDISQHDFSQKNNLKNAGSALFYLPIFCL